ncbi:single-stranded DNA-binding protein [Clostridium cadaveris]|uniref:single-stranded DNA-binding protein n=1 Tax=Clostridium cadaveris TaxID=1529 RepID=UPI0014598DF5|nr:single-stranded DNA-binding protein [Clostridium cadaveris]NME63818.1 single-stranded DNA-binding protein [Clostridium cadaveris]
MNRWIGTGRLTKDVELRYTPGEGKAVTNFNMAVDDGFGEHKKTYFINVVVWGKTAESLVTYTHKGSKVAVQGKITTRSYDAKDGTKRYVTEVIADQYGGIEFLDSKKTEENSNGNQNMDNEFGYDPDIAPIDDSDIPF